MQKLKKLFAHPWTISSLTRRTQTRPRCVKRQTSICERLWLANKDFHDYCNERLSDAMPPPALVAAVQTAECPEWAQDISQGSSATLGARPPLVTMHEIRLLTAKPRDSANLIYSILPALHIFGYIGSETRNQA